MRYHIFMMSPRLLMCMLFFTLLLPASASALSPGDRGSRVAELNNKLRSSGYLPYGYRSNTYNDKTFHAVMAAQKWLGIARDGVAGPGTHRALKRLRRPRVNPKRRARRVEVDLSKQLVYLVNANSKGKVRRTISTSTGQGVYATPLGRWRIYYKNANAYSTQYDAPMPFASFYNRGYALHASANVPGYPASHGCSRLPFVFAREVFRFADMGTPIIIKR